MGAWTFNSSLETHTVPHRDFSANETHSVLRYKPESDNDFGYLYCWAENVLGRMELPCAFQLIPAGLWSKFRTWVENHNLCVKCQWAQSKHCVGGFYSQGRRVTTW